MAWYEMEYECGHSERVQLYGKGSDRERRLEWAKENKLCPDCYKERMAEERKQQNERAKELSEKLNFAPLKGSEKQIVWAITIRQQKFEALVKAGLETEEIKNVLNLEQSAQWWIENRSDYASSLYNVIKTNRL